LNVLCELCALLFEALVQGQALQPVQTSTDFPGFGGDLFTSLGAIQAARVIGAKLSSFVVTDGAQIVTAKTQFMSMTTGTPLALLYAMHLQPNAQHALARWPSSWGIHRQRQCG